MTLITKHEINKYSELNCISATVTRNEIDWNFVITEMETNEQKLFMYFLAHGIFIKYKILTNLFILSLLLSQKLTSSYLCTEEKNVNVNKLFA